MNSGNSQAVSILMAEYNTPMQHLRASLDSILQQNFANFELILVDDGGRNDTEALVQSLNDARIRVLRNPANVGLAKSLQNGIAIASTDWIARMDTDDLYHPDHLGNLVAASRDRPGFAVYSSRSEEISDDNKRMAIGSPGELGPRQIMRGQTPIHPATLIRKDAILRVGGYPEFHRAEDLALWCELLLGGFRIYMTDDLTHSYRVELGDYSKRRLRNRSGELRARLQYYPELGAGPIEYLKLLRSIVGGVLPPRLVRAARRLESRLRG